MARPAVLDGMRRTAALLRPHAAGEGRRLAAGLMLSAALVGLHVLTPWPLKWILDHLAGVEGGAVVRWLAAAPERGILLLTLLFVGLALAAAVAEWGQVLMLYGIGNRVIYRFRTALFRHLLRLPLAYHESREVGELLTRVVYDTSRLRRGLNGALVRIAYTLALFAASFAVLLWLDLRLGIVFAAGGVLALLVMRRRGKRIARAARRQRRREGRLAALVAGELGSVRELQALGADAGAASRRFERRNDRSLRREQKVRRLEAGLSVRVEALLAVTTALALWLGVHAVVAGQLGPGDLVLFFSYAITLRRPFADFARQTARLGRTAACAERLAGIAERAPATAGRPADDEPATIEGRIELDAVFAKAPKKNRSGRKWSLENVTCSIPPGQRVAVIGGNGAGKSTLLRLVLRLADPALGVVRVDGRDLRDWPIERLRHQASVVFQDGVLADLSVRDNIALGLTAVSDEAIREAATAVGAHDFIHRLPDGYDTRIRRGGALLSGGERQRIALARALLRDGRVWLLDEPTAALDHAAAAAITELLLDRSGGRTTMWVTHDPSVIERVEWVLALEHGAVVFAGPASHYLNRPSLPEFARAPITMER